MLCGKWWQTQVATESAPPWLEDTAIAMCPSCGSTDRLSAACCASACSGGGAAECWLELLGHRTMQRPRSVSSSPSTASTSDVKQPATLPALDVATVCSYRAYGPLFARTAHAGPEAARECWCCDGIGSSVEAAGIEVLGRRTLCTYWAAMRGLEAPAQSSNRCNAATADFLPLPACRTACHVTHDLHRIKQRTAGLEYAGTRRAWMSSSGTSLHLALPH
jgi:hypothetical protein